MIINDIRSFIYDIRHAININGHKISKFYWDDPSNPDLDKLVKILSDPNDLERQVIRRVLKEKNPASILDAACGSAIELTRYNEDSLNLRYIGFDKSNYMIGLAKERFEDKQFIRGDVENLSFADNSFQAVLLKHILEHLSSYEQTVQEAVRVSENIVIIDFFHRLLPFNSNIQLYDKRGYWNNWYSRSKFENFLDTLPIDNFERIITKGTSNQTAEIYVLEK